MEAQNKFYGEALIGFLLAVFRTGFLLFSFGIALWVIVSICALLTDIPFLNTEFPVLFSLNKEGVLHNAEGIGVASFSMRQGMGIIATDALPKGFVALYIVIEFLRSLCILWVMRLIIRILEAVQMGGLLILENAIRLRWVALLGMAILFLGGLITIVSSAYLSDKLTFPGLEFSSFSLFFFATFGSVFHYLFLLVIAEAFRIGAILKEEVDLTI
ncbi:MAG: DUF2975 domain-containing protein [Saprospiraceae bacterium]